MKKNDFATQLLPCIYIYIYLGLHLTDLNKEQKLNLTGKYSTFTHILCVGHQVTLKLRQLLKFT